MIEHSDRRLKAWASWVKAPSVGGDLGYGKNLLLKILEGKGQILPSGGMPISAGVDADIIKVDSFVKGLGREEKLVVKIFYLDSTRTVDQKAARFGVTKRTLYLWIHQIHVSLASQGALD